MRTYAFIDASNLFYGGEKSLGWKIDYQRLFTYLKQKYGASRIFYFGGVETHGFKYDYLREDTVPMRELETYLVRILEKKDRMSGEDIFSHVLKSVQKARFYIKLQEFGYDLVLKPVKAYFQEDNSLKKKANCDVDMAFCLMKEKENFERVIVLSGDGDFLPVLKFLKKVGREIIVLSRGWKTAREIKQFAGNAFGDIEYLREILKYRE